MRISDNRNYIVGDDGRPFFYLADTTWRFFYDTTEAEAERYMRKRKSQGFTVFMPVLLSEVKEGESDVTRFGQLALVDWNPAKPNEEFFKYVDWAVRKAREIGLVVGILPTWGEYVDLKWGKGPACFDRDNAFVYGRFLGSRYRDDPNIIWILGGDRNPSGPRAVEIWRAMARGLREGDGGRHLVTYHPAPCADIGQFSCSHWFPNEDWLDFYLLQTGTTIDRDNYTYIRRDYLMEEGCAKKPTLDGECRYEYSHEAFYRFPNPTGRRIDAHQVRKAAYNSMLSGAAGHTYGCRCVWNFWEEGTPKTRDTDLDWRKALDLPGAWNFIHFRSLFEKYPFYKLVPDFEGKVVVYGQGSGGTYIPAAVSEDRDFALLYSPEPLPFRVDLDVVDGPVRIYRYDVRTGATITVSDGGLSGKQDIEPAEGGEPDWVYIIEKIGR